MFPIGFLFTDKCVEMYKQMFPILLSERNMISPLSNKIQCKNYTAIKLIYTKTGHKGLLLKLIFIYFTKFRVK